MGYKNNGWQVKKKWDTLEYLLEEKQSDKRKNVVKYNIWCQS